MGAGVEAITHSFGEEFQLNQPDISLKGNLGVCQRSSESMTCKFLRVSIEEEPASEVPLYSKCLIKPVWGFNPRREKLMTATRVIPPPNLVANTQGIS